MSSQSSTALNWSMVVINSASALFLSTTSYIFLRYAPQIFRQNNEELKYERNINRCCRGGNMFDENQDVQRTENRPLTNQSTSS